MSKKFHLRFIFFISTLFCYTQATYSQQSDTLFFNSKWEICEKPFASYYRFGGIVIDTFWYYKGNITDYYLTDTIEMQGSYSDIGEKDGQFLFYYPNGNLKARGNYSANHMKGNWEYFYKNGNPKMKIDYAGDDKNFTVLDFQDSTGKVMAKDGTGQFEIYVTYTSNFTVLRLSGEFANGKRSGTWHYFLYQSSKNEEVQLIKEVYENGTLKKGSIYNPYNGLSDTYKKPNEQITVREFNKLKVTEFFSKDRTSFQSIKNDQDLADFLIKRRAPSFNVEGGSFEESYTDVFKKLNTPAVLRYFSDPEKKYSGEVLINLSDSGDIEEIEITGNLSEKEKEYMFFFLKKFKNIHEIIVENVGIDAYHKIYFYSVFFAEFIPKRYLENLPEKQFLFSPIPYDKLKEAIKLKSKKEKKN